MADFNNTIFGELKIVDPPIRVLSFGPVKDSMLVESQPLLDYGEYNSIQISDGSDGKYAGIFGFAPLAVTASQWSALKRVKLILTTNGYHPDPSQVAIYVVRDDTWTEYGINWGNQPVHEEVPITGYEVEANAGTITFDLTDYFKNFGDITGKSFNFYVKSDVKTERPLSVCSKEYSVAENRPKLTVSYYDYQSVPILSSINSDINVVACARSEIECDLTVQSNFVSADISCAITVPKFALTPAEIVCDLSVEQRVLAEIACDLLVEKQVLLPADIDCDITVLRTLPAVDIACDLTVEKQTIQSEITADIIAAAVLTPVDVECTVLVEKQAINGDLPADISVSVKTTPVDIECTATVEKQPYSFDIAGDINVVISAYADIECDLNVEKQVVPALDINCDITAVPGVGADIECDMLAVLPMIPKDVESDITVIPAVVGDINCDITVHRTVVSDIECDMKAAQRTDAFIDCTVYVGVNIAKEINCDIEVKAAAYLDIACDITVQSTAKSGSYSYIIS